MSRGRTDEGVKRPVTPNTGLPFVQVIHDSDHWRGQFQTLVVDQPRRRFSIL